MLQQNLLHYWSISSLNFFPRFFKCNREGSHGYRKRFSADFTRKLSLRGSKETFHKIIFTQQKNFTDVFILEVCGTFLFLRELIFLIFFNTTCIKGFYSCECLQKLSALKQFIELNFFYMRWCMRLCKNVKIKQIKNALCLNMIKWSGIVKCFVI